MPRPILALHDSRLRWVRQFAALTLGLAWLTGCSGGSTASSPVPPPVPPLRPSTGPTVAAHPSKVLLVVEENHSEQQAVSGMPYLASLARAYGSTTDYRAVAHPSLPNYLALAGGSTFGVSDDRDPSSHPVTGASVFDQAVAHGRTAKVYADAMPGNCDLASSGRYAVRHNPWAYFADPSSRANCRRFDVPAGTTDAGALHDDIRAGTLPNVGMLVPDLCHDAHDCSLATADGWLRSWLGAVQAGPDFQAGRLAVVITFDEDDGDGASSNRVLTTVVARRTRAVSADRPYTHYSWTRYAAELAGSTPPRAARTATSLRPAFGL